jgi:hypothetical protein
MKPKKCDCGGFIVWKGVEEFACENCSKPLNSELCSRPGCKGFVVIDAVSGELVCNKCKALYED